MKKLLLLFLLIPNICFAGTLTIPTVYAPTGQVTSTNINGNFNAIATVVNGGLDNTNANTVSGYRFVEVKSSLPTAGTQGKVVYLTSDNTLNFDTGSTFVKIHETPVGEIIIWSTATAPTNYLLCDGTAVSRALYPDLFAVIGTTYGVGDSSTTFNLPNLKGKVPIGYDATQTEVDALAETGGEKTHALSEAEMPAHTHTIAYSNPNNSVGNGTGSILRSGSTTATSSVGSGTAHNTLPPYLTLNFAIKYR